MRQDRTKKLFADALKQLSKTKQLEKVTIKDICTMCECNHSTFYYHFSDKDELIEWILKTEIEDHFNDVDLHIWTNNTYHLLSVFQKDCEFYRQCLSLNTHNSLRRLIYNINQRAVRTWLDTRLKGTPLSEEARNFFVLYVSAGFSETNIRYIEEGAKTSPKKMLEHYYDFSEPFLEDILERFVAHDSGTGMDPIKPQA